MNVTINELRSVAAEDAGIIKIRDATFDNKDEEQSPFHQDTVLSKLLFHIKLFPKNLPLLQR